MSFPIAIMLKYVFSSIGVVFANTIAWIMNFFYEFFPQRMSVRK